MFATWVPEFLLLIYFNCVSLCKQQLNLPVTFDVNYIVIWFLSKRRTPSEV